MEGFDSRVDTQTPRIATLDPRGVALQSIDFLRTSSSDPHRVLVTATKVDLHGFATALYDPRRYTTDASPAAIIWIRDLPGRALRTRSIDSGQHHALYDSAGRLNALFAATGLIQEHRYDDDGHSGLLIAIDEYMAGNSETRVTNRFVLAGSGVDARARNLAGKHRRHYDSAGLLECEAMTITGHVAVQARRLLLEGQLPSWPGEDEAQWQSALNDHAYRTQAFHDATGMPLMKIDAMGHVGRFDYDRSGRPLREWIRPAAGTEQIVFTIEDRNAHGQVSRERLGNGVVADHAYEPDTSRQYLLRLTTIDAQVLQDLRWQYDPAGNVLSAIDTAYGAYPSARIHVGANNRYAYDSLYRLVEASGREATGTDRTITHTDAADGDAVAPYYRSFAYDDAGNLTNTWHRAATGNIVTRKITVSARGNRAVGSELTDNPREVGRFFDEGGHQLQLSSAVLRWNTRGQLQHVVATDGTGDEESYCYAGDAVRITKIRTIFIDGTAECRRTLYLPALQRHTREREGKCVEDLHVIMTTNHAGTRARMLHWAIPPHGEARNDDIRFVHADINGNTILELDGKGSIVSREEFYPYGETAVWMTAETKMASYKTDRFSSQERDETGLYSFNHRYYDPTTGRWLSADPAGVNDGMNLYAMAHNNPTSRRDLNGLQVGKVTRTIAGAFAGTAGSMLFVAQWRHRNATTRTAGPGPMGQQVLPGNFASQVRYLNATQRRRQYEVLGHLRQVLPGHVNFLVDMYNQRAAMPYLSAQAIVRQTWAMRHVLRRASWEELGATIPFVHALVSSQRGDLHHTDAVSTAMAYAEPRLPGFNLLLLAVAGISDVLRSPDLLLHGLSTSVLRATTTDEGHELRLSSEREEAALNIDRVLVQGAGELAMHSALLFAGAAFPPLGVPMAVAAGLLAATQAARVLDYGGRLVNTLGHPALPANTIREYVMQMNENHR